MRSSVEAYVEWKAAIDRAVEQGFNIKTRFDGIHLTHIQTDRMVAEPFREAREVHMYLNGLLDHSSYAKK